MVSRSPTRLDVDHVPNEHLPGSSPVAGFILLVAYFVRWLMPVESITRGDTLWVALFWFLAGAIAIFLQRKQAGGIVARLDWSRRLLWAGVLLVVIGLVVSGACVVFQSGAKSPVRFFLWEFTAAIPFLAGMFLTLESAAFRQQLLAGMLTLGAVLAGFGLYQNMVEQPSLVSKFQPIFDELKGLPAESSRAAELRRKLDRAGIPSEGAARELFERRLIDSREPFAFFALANTFAGFLVVALLLWTDTLASGPLNRTRWPVILAWLIVGYVLLLTKCRTAWAATLAGAFLWGIARFGWGYHALRSMSRWGIAMAVVSMIGIGIAFQTGNFDRWVIDEAIKSLGYRWQYWVATSSLLADFPVLGVGPGQFRDFYLQYRLPVASEEIADPHNAVLDVWTSGGMLSLVGLLLVVISQLAAISRLLSLHQSTAATSITEPVTAPLQAGFDLSEAIRSLLANLLGPVPVACLVALMGQAWFSTHWDDRLIAIMIVSAIFAAILSLCENRIGQLHPACLIGGAVALLIHLQGAGGILTPAVFTTIILLTWTAVSPADHVEDKQQENTQTTGSPRSIIGPIFAIGSIVFAAILAATSLSTVLALKQLELQASEAFESGRIERGQLLLAEAAARDGWADEPCEQLANWSWRLAQQSSGNESNRFFEQALKWNQEAQSRRPRNYRTYWQRGLWEHQFSKRTSTPDASLLKSARSDLEHALLLCPTHASILADLAYVARDQGDVQATHDFAERGLAQDQINIERRHLDRLYTEEQRQKVRDLLKSTRVPQ